MLAMARSCESDMLLDEKVREHWRDPKWYVLWVRSNQERMVSHALTCRNVEHYLPCTRSVRLWKDRRVKLEMPLFSGYVFVRLRLVERMKVLTVPNVVSLVGPKS